MHPDKNKESNATESFQLVTKAYEVLTGNETRKLFDYYLSNPRVRIRSYNGNLLSLTVCWQNYFKVSGQHYYKNLPKTDVRIVVAVAMGLLTWLFYVIQYQKYERVVKYLKFATLNNLNMKNGGTRQTIELHRRASELYVERVKDCTSLIFLFFILITTILNVANNIKGSKSPKTNMLKDPLFETIVEEVS